MDPNKYITVTVELTAEQIALLSTVLSTAAIMANAKELRTPLNIMLDDLADVWSEINAAMMQAQYAPDENTLSVYITDTEK